MRINVNEVFSEDEIFMMEHYVTEYARVPERSNREERTPFTQVLDMVWADNKREIYKMFGEQLILRKKIEVAAPVEAIRDQIQGLDEYFRLQEMVARLACELPEEQWHYNDYGRRTNNLYLALECIVNDSWALATNKYEYEQINFPLPDGTVLKYTKGSKPVRFLGKIAAQYGFEEVYEEFRLAHSRVLNTAKLGGDLCLSIHPLDYLTMSDNTNNWQSCMSWREHGCYRTGTVEMMNSPRVIVAYLESADKMTINGAEWNNKKWRTLVVLDNEYITTIKGYPYQSESLSKVVSEWVAELANAAGANFNDKAEIYYNEDGTFYIPETDKELHVEYETCRMYNDFGTGVGHAFVLAKEISPRWKNINYSGENQCVWCGEVREFNYDEEGLPAEYLVCATCGAPDAYCRECGNWVYSDELEMVRGDYICRYCYECRTSEDAFTRERDYNWNLRQIYIVRDGETRFDGSECNSFWVHTDGEAWGRISDYVHQKMSWWDPVRYIWESDIPDDMYKHLLDFFGVESLVA